MDATQSDTGGDRAPVGPAGNALKHGLTARKNLPLEMRLRTAFFREQFAAEFKPASPLQHVMLDELARHAAGMEYSEYSELPILRAGGRQGSSIGTAGDGDEIHAEACFAASMSSLAIERLCRYRRAHERGFYLALDRLRELQLAQGQVAAAQAAPSFRTDAECEAHLLERIQSPDFRCPPCGGTKGNWLDARKRWQCAGCRRQLGLRAGTVMEGSPLPLKVWFKAIIAVLIDSSVSPAQLGKAVGVSRAATVRRMLTKIEEALKLPNSSQLLAGLDRVVQADLLRQAPRNPAILQNKP